MEITKELMANAKKLAQENYESWGQWIVEGYGDEELAQDLADHASLDEWVDIRISVAEIHRERGGRRLIRLFAFTNKP